MRTKRTARTCGEVEGAETRRDETSHPMIEAVGSREGDGFATILEVQRHEDFTHVVLDCEFGQAQLAADFLIGQIMTDQGQDFNLSGRELGKACALGSGRLYQARELVHYALDQRGIESYFAALQLKE